MAKKYQQRFPFGVHCIYSFASTKLEKNQRTFEVPKAQSLHKAFGVKKIPETNNMCFLRIRTIAEVTYIEGKFPAFCKMSHLRMFLSKTGKPWSQAWHTEISPTEDIL